MTRPRTFAPQVGIKHPRKSANDFRTAAREASVTPHCLSMTVFAYALACSASVHAQTTAGMGPVALQGTVSSAQEGAMEGVLVSAKKAGSTITTTVVTDEKGHYALPASRLQQPGHYDITIRAVGYRLKDGRAADVVGGAAASADIALEKVSDLHQLADQLSNGDWLNSMPGNGFGCADCHTFQRIVNSTHTADEWMKVIPRMATYSNGSTPEQPQPLVPGPRQANEAPRNQAQLRRTAEYLASINLSKGPDWSYPLKPLPRPKGRATHVIITTYDLPRP
jgi:virginiamycin B lyase